MKKSLVGVGLTLLVGVACCRRWRPFRVTVRGESMAPVLRDGDACVVIGSPTTAVRVGDIVVARHPLYPGEELVKRVTRRPTADECWLEGDAADSLDSRELGPFPLASITGTVIAVYLPLRRAKIFRGS